MLFASAENIFPGKNDRVYLQVVNPESNKYRLIVRGLFKNFKASFIKYPSSLRRLNIMKEALKFLNKPLTIRKYLLDSGFTTLPK